MKDILIKKITTRCAKVGVIGLGYVGLPLALEKAKAGYDVIGFDIQKKRVDMVNQGLNYIGDIIDKELKEVITNKKLVATSDYQEIANLDIITICVPTPLDEHYQPNISDVQNSSKVVANYLHKGMLIVLESTTYPGTTRDVVMPILEETGLRCGVDFYLAFSPERVDPGNKLYNTKNTPKVVGGITKGCTEVAAAMYESILDGEIYQVSSPEVAEMEKILENSYRNVNIALANEMAILCNRMGINVWEVIDAAKTKPYGFQAFYPGPGVGGHCIPIDPFYLTWKAREYDYHTRLIEVAGEINNYMPEYTVDRAMKILNEDGKALKGSTVLVLGIAYKQDIDDYRESAALKVIANLEKYGSNVIYNDPYVPEFQNKKNLKHYKSVELNENILKETDLVIITTMHTCYDYKFIVKHSNKVLDTKNATNNAEGNNIIRL
jgi:UDP-N-acetyl-D-glucosamine dehydrogenase